MANSLYEKKVQITLELNLNEAKYLREASRNPPHGVAPDDEDLEESEMRSEIFTALDGAITEVEKD